MGLKYCLIIFDRPLRGLRMTIEFVASLRIFFKCVISRYGKFAKEEASINERNNLEKDIRKQYELGCGTLRPNDHHLLESNIEDILAKNTKAQKYWIRKRSVSRKYNDASEKNMLRGMRNIMNNWAMMPD